MEGYDVMDVVKRVGEMKIPAYKMSDNWFKKLTFKNGRTDLVGCLLLSQITYWYMPTHTDDGKVITKKFRRDMVQLSNSALAQKLNLSKKQVRDGLDRLEATGVIRQHLRTVTTKSGDKIPNMQFIELDPDRLDELTSSSADEAAPPEEASGETAYDMDSTPVLTPPATRYADESTYVPTCEAGHVAPQGNTNTKNKTKNTSKNTSGEYINHHPDDDAFNQTEIKIKRNIEYDELINNMNGEQIEFLEYIVKLMTGAVNNEKDLTINGSKYPYVEVREHLMAINSEQMQELFERLFPRKCHMRNSGNYCMASLLSIENKQTGTNGFKTFDQTKMDEELDEMERLFLHEVNNKI